MLLTTCCSFHGVPKMSFPFFSGRFFCELTVCPSDLDGFSQRPVRTGVCGQSLSHGVSSPRVCRVSSTAGTARRRRTRPKGGTTPYWAVSPLDVRPRPGQIPPFSNRPVFFLCLRRPPQSQAPPTPGRSQLRLHQRQLHRRECEPAFSPPPPPPPLSLTHVTQS